MINKIDKNAIRRRKHVRVRKKISGTPARPRLCVFRSNTNIYAQIIDDEAGNTLVSASTLDKEVKASIANGSNKEGAAAVGKLIAERALAKDIKEVVFDRGGYIFHGRIEALAEAAREAGLVF
ncbi:MAG: 50S ribosomal protein L18 [Lachnospiraceae bacterium]|nr:50S ribosomal protein L18 [Clostridiales bacterium]MBR6850178.1 50S ribosomal protein L18 [Lachnospiraceae bacterium]